MRNSCDLVLLLNSRSDYTLVTFGTVNLPCHAAKSVRASPHLSDRACMADLRCMQQQLQS